MVRWVSLDGSIGGRYGALERVGAEGLAHAACEIPREAWCGLHRDDAARLGSVPLAKDVCFLVLPAP